MIQFKTELTVNIGSSQNIMALTKAMPTLLQLQENITAPQNLHLTQNMTQEYVKYCFHTAVCELQCSLDVVIFPFHVISTICFSINTKTVSASIFHLIILCFKKAVRKILNSSPSNTS